ncbi:hypothetical protein SAY86_002012 [Trapa natans]|uniref:endo-polygalacturonase n=1 Tax=Trapa natans TaxID=22666 RepID=A0AAN7LCJ1_TRANT|nr:hypothetical protein SAY86_002012 [Trapa natans]
MFQHLAGRIWRCISSQLWPPRGRRSHRSSHAAGRNMGMLSTRLSHGNASLAKAYDWYLVLVKVDDYGAKGDGIADDTEAFRRAWSAACSSEGGVFTVPSSGVYRLRQITFSGPCKSGFLVKIYGRIIASDDPADYESDHSKWLTFENLDNLSVEGGGSVDGNGMKWWSRSCKVNPSLALKFYKCSNVRVTDLTLKNAQQMHLIFQDCENVRATNLRITAPASSPNTDGIHVTGTRNILIDNCLIGTGDDCVSIVGGSKYVEVSNIRCGPGHGISIGSLGADNARDHVSEVYVHGAMLWGTANGVRIKTWQGGSGYAKNIRFEDIGMINVTNPIIIDQNYCDRADPCHEERSAVQVSNVMYQNIIGTSASEVAMKFDCSRSHPCREISLQGIILRRSEGTKTAHASCAHVNFAGNAMVYPNCH